MPPVHGAHGDLAAPGRRTPDDRPAAVNAPDGFALDGSDPSPVARAIVKGLAAEKRAYPEAGGVEGAY